MNESQREASLVGRLVDGISECVPAIGTKEFIERFLDVVRLIGAGQVTAFAYERAKVRCLLSRNFLSEAKGGTLTAAYLDGWYREDPLFERTIAMSENDCTVLGLQESLPHISAPYFAKLCEAAGFGRKVAVLVAQDSLRMVLNLYFGADADTPSTPARVFAEAGLYRLFGRACATHFLRVSVPDFPLPLTVLSERERQVCVGMLAGKKAEVIAGEMNVSTSSVVTFRKRAYQKLGISSRGQLFSICHSSSQKQWKPRTALSGGSFRERVR